VEDELNVDVVEVTDELGDVLAYELVPNYKLLGARLRERVQPLRAAMRTVDGVTAAADLAAGRPVVVQLEDGPVELVGEEIELRVKAQPGFAVSRDGAEVVALVLGLDDGLRLRGLAREVIRHVQDLRKAAGLEVSDWIHLHLVGLPDLEPMAETIAREVLARTVRFAPPDGGAPGTVVQIDAGDSVREATIWVIKA
jgi:isoleucyl-tRNA synthetase